MSGLLDGKLFIDYRNTSELYSRLLDVCLRFFRPFQIRPYELGAFRHDSSFSDSFREPKHPSCQRIHIALMSAPLTHSDFVTNVSDASCVFLTILQTNRECHLLAVAAEMHVTTELQSSLRTGTARAYLAGESSTHGL